MQEIDDLTLKLESLKPEETKTIPVKKSTAPAFTHEEWRLEKHVDPIYENGRHKTIDNKPQYDIKFSRKDLLRKVMLTDQSQVDALNEQSQNTLLEYVPIKKGE
jgi:carbamoylphosphate synthase large subunit